MNIKPDQLSSHLQKQLKPVYLVSGDEHLLVQESCDLIRIAARSAGFEEREVFDVTPQFAWDELLTSGTSLSLFAQRKIIEVRVPSGKTGDVGSKTFQAYCQNLSENNLLLVIMPKLDKRTLNSKWCKTLDQAGAHITIWPIDSDHMPHWISRRLRQAGLETDREASALLAELVDGNLLAANQEIEKLKLLATDAIVTADTIHQSVANSSRYNVFNLVDAALKGNAKKTSKIIAGLKAEGNDALSIVWALAREVRQLALISNAIANGQSPQQAMQQQSVWRNRQSLVEQALKRTQLSQFETMVSVLSRVDRLSKGVGQGNAWDELESVTLMLAGATLAIDAL